MTKASYSRTFLDCVVVCGIQGGNCGYDDVTGMVVTDHTQLANPQVLGGHAWTENWTSQDQPSLRYAVNVTFLINCH